jgi:hypothetical protein
MIHHSKDLTQSKKKVRANFLPSDRCSSKLFAVGSEPEAQGPKTADTDTPVETKKSKSRAGGTAGAAVHPKTTDPTSWEVEVPW